MTGNCGWGYKNSSTGIIFTVSSTTADGNNQSNAGICAANACGGIQFTANPTNWRVIGTRSGNDAVEGGNQGYGLDISAPASNTGVIAGDDFRGNNLGPIHMPAGLGNIGVDAAYFGSAVGSNIIGPEILPEETAPGGTAGQDIFWGDSTAHRFKMNNNNGGAFLIPGINAAGVAGNGVKLAANGIDIVDAGAPAIGFTMVNVTPVTSSGGSTTNDQNLMALTIPAGSLNSVSRTLLVQLAGVYSTPAASTTAVNVKLKLCTVSGCGSGTVLTLANVSSTALAGIQATNDPFNLTFNISTQTAGATASFEAHGNLTIDISALTTAAEGVFADGNTTTIGTIDTTAQLFLQTAVAFTVASASNVATQRQMIADTVD